MAVGGGAAPAAGAPGGGGHRQGGTGRSDVMDQKLYTFIYLCLNTSEYTLDNYQRNMLSAIIVPLMPLFYEAAYWEKYKVEILDRYNINPFYSVLLSTTARRRGKTTITAIIITALMMTTNGPQHRVRSLFIPVFCKRQKQADNFLKEMVKIIGMMPDFDKYYEFKKIAHELYIWEKRNPRDRRRCAAFPGTGDVRSAFLAFLTCLRALSPLSVPVRSPVRLREAALGADLFTCRRRGVAQGKYSNAARARRRRQTCIGDTQKRTVSRSRFLSFFFAVHARGKPHRTGSQVPAGMSSSSSLLHRIGLFRGLPNAATHQVRRSGVHRHARHGG